MMKRAREAKIGSGLIIVHVCGGLGNQMFQYAMGRAKSLTHGTRLLLDTSWFKRMQGCTPRRFALPLFPALEREDLYGIVSRREREAMRCAHLPLLHSLWLRVRNNAATGGPLAVIEQHPKFSLIVAKAYPPLYLHGYWQSENYFAAHAEDIRRDFSFPTLKLAAAKNMQERILSCSEAVAVHIRRGDYVRHATARAWHGQCSPAYYEQALNSIAQAVSGAQVFIFSDEPDWAREHFDTQGLPAHIIDMHGEHDAVHDMHLMTLCRHHVVANSSFSWWGAWLSKLDGLKFTPTQWLADSSVADFNPSPDNWIRL